MAISQGDAWGISGIRLSGQSVLALNSETEDCAKHVRVWARLPVSDSDRRLGGHPSRSHKLKTYRTDH